MIAIFIIVLGHVFQCIEAVCQEVPIIPIGIMIKAGMLELIFESVGIIRIYKRKKRD